MMPWTSFWAFGVIITIIPLPVLSENATHMVRASTHPRFRTALNMQCFAADIENECQSNKYLRATTCSENPECLLMKGNCGWCQCPANPRDLARFGLQPITLDDGTYLLNPASIPGNKIHVSELEIHYGDVIMGPIASQITSFIIVYSTVYSDAHQRNHQSSASLGFMREFTGHRWIPRTKGQLRGKCFHLTTSSWYLLTCSS